MDIEGRIILDLGVQSGTSKAGNLWKKRELVLETFGQYPRKVKFHIFGDRVDSINLELGKDYILSFDLESREYNGRWYTDVNVYRAQDFTQQQNGQFSNNQGSVGYGNPSLAGQSFPNSGDNNNNFGQGLGGMTPSFEASDPDSDEDLPF